MRNAKLIIVVPMIIIAAAVVVVVAISPPRGTVRYHLERLGSLRQQQPWSGPSSFGDYFRPRTWAWYLRGRLSVSDRVAAMEEHQNALIRLGYFERREFTLRHRRLGAEFWSEFRPAVSNATLADWR